MNIEKTIIDFLNGIEDLGCKAYGEVPDDRPDIFISVERTGGGQGNSLIIDTPTVAIQCWNTSKDKASDMAYQVRDLLKRLVYDSRITRVTPNALYNYPDTSGQARYQLVVDFVTTR